MPNLVTRTRKQLSEIGSPDEFERLAAAVLRAAVPAYASLLHVGTNASGRAVRSPVDGIDIRIHRGTRRLLLVQHTITARRDLRRKWLDVTDGDIAKARAILDAELARGAVSDATLVLTSIADPDQQLIRDVHAAAGSGMKVDLWAASRIADFLDRDPEGQWLREQQFGTEAIRLSATHARAISRQSIADYLPLVPRDDAVPRSLDSALARFVREGRGTGFVIGESGLGKSVSLRRLGDEWLGQGGLALILAHELIEQASTVEQAIMLGLRHWAPALDLECGHSALALATPEQPLLLIVEDVNRSTNPRRIVERLVGWSVTTGRADKGQAPAHRWRLLCPAWRGNSGLSDTNLRDYVIRNSFIVERFERAEAVQAIKARAKGAGVELTSLQCNDLAMALGDDPLLIGLNRDWSAPSPQDAIQSYVTANIEEVADDRLLASDLRHALEVLSERLIESRTIFPEWQQIRSWVGSADGDTLSAIRRLIDQGRIIHLGGVGGERLTYRHDRVRDHLLTRAMIRLIEEDRLSPELWSEPFYAELIGGALSVLPPSVIREASVRNPVALFAALQEPGLDETRRGELIKAAERWITSSGFQEESCDQQRHHAMQYLARTDGAFVPALADRFPRSFPRLEALVRNGGAFAAASVCARSDPGTNDAWRDRMIAHARSRHPNFVADVANLIRSGDLSPDLLEGALNLVGEVGDPALCDALAERWTGQAEKSLSTGWLWAALRCCPRAGHPLADTLCDLWARLPTKLKRGDDKLGRNPRWDIAGYSLPHAFGRKSEQAATAFLIARAKRDRRLKHVLTSILSDIDSPEAILYSVQYGAKIQRRTKKTGGINLFGFDLERTWSPEQHGRTLSTPSRAAVEKVWRNRRISQFERSTAFRIWCQTPTRDELADLPALEADPVLADAALRTRLDAGDQSAVPLLKQRIWTTERGYYWWYYARRVGLAGMRDEVLRFMESRRHGAADDARADYGDSIVAQLLMDERDEFAMQTISANWDHLKTSPCFVQAALYLATPEAVRLAQSAIADSGTPERMLQHIDSHWGIRTDQRVGVTNLAQLQALEPYYATMSEMEFGGLLIGSFFDAANGLRALSWRKEHLDPLIIKVGRGECPADQQALFRSLDSEVATYLQYERRWFSIDHWFERREEELWERSALLAIIGEWACARASEPAVALLAEALSYFGERQDLALFDALDAPLRASCADTIANCAYDVRRRSLASV